jgi:hypothetical protein
MPGEAAHGDIPPHGLNDKKMIEMAAFEEFGLLGRVLLQINQTSALQC